MRKVTMVRLGIAAAVSMMGVAGALGSGCSSSNSNNPDGGASSGDSGATGPSDGSALDTGTGQTGDSSTTPTDGGAIDAGPPHAHLVLVHAAIGIGPLRVCFAASSSNGTEGPIFPVNPLPDSLTTQPPYPYPGVAAASTPGVYPGTIGAIADIASLATEAITPFIIDATQIAYDQAVLDGGGGGNTQDGGKELNCAALLGAMGTGGILPATAYWQLPQIPTGTFLDGNTYLLAVTGCPAGYVPPDPFGENPPLTTAGACGGGDDGGAPNLAVQIVHLDTTTPVPVDGGFGVQFANFSSSLAGDSFHFSASPPLYHLPASEGVVPGFLVPNAPIDAGEDAAPVTPPPSWVPVAAGPVTYPSATTAATVVAVDPTQPGVQFGFLTAPGSLPDGGYSFVPFPGEQTGPATFTPGDVIAQNLNGPAGTSAISNLSSWASSVAAAPAAFATGTTFTFVFIGDDNYTLIPNSDGGAPSYDGRFMHIVAFPNVFTPNKY